MDNLLDKLVEACCSVFQNNLIGVLWLGSTTKNDSTPFSDLDIIVIVREFKNEQFFDFSNLMPEFERKLDLHFFCLDQAQSNVGELTLGSNGCYYWHFALKKAICLYGTNIFLSWSEPSQEQLRQSVLNKINQYTYWARSIVLVKKLNLSLEENHKLNIRIIKCIKDFLFLTGQYNFNLSNEDVVTIFIKIYSEILNSDELVILCGLANPELTNSNAANLSRNYLKSRVAIINKLFKASIKIF